MDPAATGRDAPRIFEISQIKLGGITWERRFWREFGFSSYIPSIEEVGGLTFLFTVSYEEYSMQGEKLAEQILSTFRFLDLIDAGQNSSEGKFCGGFVANLPENQCPSGYKCQLEGDYPDAGGKCVRE